MEEFLEERLRTMKLWKRTLSLLLVGLMLANMMPLNVLAADGETVPAETQVQETQAPAEAPEETQAPEDDAGETEEPPQEQTPPADETPSEPQEPVFTSTNDSAAAGQAATDEAVAAVQDMIDALPEEMPMYEDETQDEYEARLEELEERLEDLYKTFETLTEEQAAQLDVTKAENAKELIYQYHLANLPMLIAAGTQADPHVNTIGAGQTATDGKSLYTWITETVGWKTDKHFYAEPVDGGSRINFTNATGSQYTGYITMGKDISIPVGTYEIIAESQSGWPMKYTEQSVGYIRIEAAKAEESVVALKAGVTAGSIVEVPVNFFYDLDAAEQNFVANVVKAAADTKEGYDPSKMVLNGYIDTVGIGWTAYTSAMRNKKHGDTERAQLVYDGMVVGEFTIKFMESRPTVAIENVVGPAEALVYVDKPEDAGVADVKANTTFTLSDDRVSKDQVTFSAESYRFDRFDGVEGKLIGEGETKSINFTLKLADTADYIGAKVTIAVSIRNITDANGNGIHDGDETQYTINWVNGEETVKSVNAVSGVQVAYDGEEPTKASDGSFHYYFAGWDTNGDGTADVALTGGIAVEEADITAVAVYTAKAIVTVKYDFNGGVDAEAKQEWSQSVEVGSATPGAPTVTRENYTFVKWDPDVAETVEAAVTYVAQWKADTDVNNNNIADQEESFRITWKVEGQEDRIVDVKWGQVPAYEGTVPAPANKTFTGWDATPVAVVQDAVYTATFSNDTVYEVRFLVDGVLYGEIQYVNVTKNQTISDVAAPDKEYAVFGGWDKAALIGTVPTGPVEINATWLEDANNNNVVDTAETATVKMDITGGEYADIQITGATDKILLTKQDDVTYSVVMDSADAENGSKINVAYTLKDTKATDGSVDYTVKAPEASYMLTAGQTTTVSAAFANVALEEKAEKNPIYFNKGAEDWDISDLKKQVLDAVLEPGYNADAYTVEIKVKIIVDLFADVTSTDRGVPAAIAAALKLGASDFRITKNENGQVPAVSKELKLNVLDSRLVLGIETAEAEMTFSGKREVSGIQETVKGLFTVTSTDPQTGAVANVAVEEGDVVWAPAYAWPGDAQSSTHTVTVTVKDSSKYQNDASASVAVTLTDTTIMYTVTYQNGYNETGVGTFENVPELTATPKPADPTREFYSFAGWTPEVPATVPAGVEGGENQLTYTATWTPVLDNNGNGIADQEETYTVVYVLGNGEADVTYRDLAWGVETPVMEKNPTWEGYNFKGWDLELPDTVTAPAEGNTITYTAQWTQKHVVTFVNNGSERYEDVEHGMTVAEPETPVWEDHDFLGWYNDDEKYDFTKAVTGNLTLTAKWRADANDNDIEDATEFHGTIVYMDGDMELEKFEDVLIGIKTPTIADPVKENHIFRGWDPAVAEKTAFAADGETITYTAQWLNDTNNNGVEDARETISVSAEGSGKVTINGTETHSYHYDSTKVTSITIKAVPETTGGIVTEQISSTYVAEIKVNGEPVDFTYAEDYSVTLEIPVNGAPTDKTREAEQPDGQSQSVEVTFQPIAFAYNEERLMSYYVGQKNVSNETVYKTIVNTPALGEGSDYSIQYLAREETSYQVDLDTLLPPSDNYLSNLVIEGLKGLLSSAGLNDIKLPDLWLDVNVENLSDEIDNSMDLDEAVATYLNKDTIDRLLKVIEDNGGVLNGGISAARDEVNAIIADITAALKYHGAHHFGKNENASTETVTEQIKLSYKCAAYYIEGENDITLKDLRAGSMVAGQNVSVVFKNYTNEDVAAAVGAYVTDGQGNPLADAQVKAVKLDVEHKGVSDTPYEVTFRYDGNDTYKPSEGTFQVTVTKAPIESFNVPDLVVSYGESYSLAPAVKPGNAYGTPEEIQQSVIQFLIGLDVADINVDDNGVSGLDTRVQLFLPKDLQDVLDQFAPDLANKEMSLGDLAKYLDLINVDSVAFLKQAIEAIQQVVGATDITVFVGNELPKDIGLYFHGAVSTNTNYDIAYDVGYLFIKPAAQQVYMQWNYTATNGLFTHDLLQLEGVNLSASAYDDAAFTTLNAAASGQVNNLFFGIDANGEVVLRLFDKAESENPDLLEQLLPNGAYTQLSFLLEFGNELYYGAPIVRAFVMTPGLVKLEIEDGADTNTRTYNGKPQTLALNATQGGNAVTLKEESLTWRFVGLETDVQTYDSNVAPTDAGAYLATVLYLEKDANGKILDVGADVETLVIAPVQSQITVSDVRVTNDGTEYKGADLVEAGPELEGKAPATTVITTSIAINDAGTRIGADINVDFPGWIDQLLEKYELLQDKNLSIGNVAQGLTALRTKLEEAGAANEVLNSLGNLIDNLSKLNAEAGVTFHDDKTYHETGVYLVIGVVTDPNYLPSADTGVLIIQPEIAELTLEWVFNDPNNNYIFLLETLKNHDLSARVAGENPRGYEPRELYLGVNTHSWEFVLTQDQKDLSLGAYTEIAYLLDASGQSIAYAAPITRAFAVVPGAVEVTFRETAAADGKVQFPYDGQAHGLTALVKKNGVEVSEAEYQNLTLRYIGVQTNGKAYDSAEAPTNAGVYTVNASYIEKLDGAVANMGAAQPVILAIVPVEAQIAVETKAVLYTGSPVEAVSVTAPVAGETPDTTILTAELATDGSFSEVGMAALKGAVNVDFPAWLDQILEKYMDRNQDYTAKTLADALGAVKAPLEELGIQAEVVNALCNALENLPGNAKVTFRDGVRPVNVGAYLTIGVITDSNYLPAMDAGVVVIYPEITKHTLSWKHEDANNIVYLSTLANNPGYLDACCTDCDLIPEYLYIGTDVLTGETRISSQQPKAPGIYTQIAFVDDLDSDANVAKPLIRTVILATDLYNVAFNNPDRLFVYDGNPHEMGAVTVTRVSDGQGVNPGNGTLTITYTGTDALGNYYQSTQAPVNAGAYVATAMYVETDGNGVVTAAGAAVGAMVIQKAPALLDMQDTTVTYDGEGHFVKVVNEQGLDYLTVIFDKEADVATIVLEDDTAAVYEKLKPVIEQLMGKPLDGDVNFSELLGAIHEAIDLAKGYQIPQEVLDKLPEELKNQLVEPENQARWQQFLEALEGKIPVNGTVKIGTELPKDVGTYHFCGFSVSQNYMAQVTEGKLEIIPAKFQVSVADAYAKVGDAAPAPVFTENVPDALNIGLKVIWDKVDMNAPGVYDSLVTWTESKNYQVEVSDGQLTVVEIAGVPTDAIDMKVGDKEQLEITAVPADATVEYTVAQGGEDVISVNEKGEIEAKGEGEAQIQVTVKVGDEVIDTYTIDVNVAKLELTVTMAEVILKKGDSLPETVGYTASGLAEGDSLSVAYNVDSGLLTQAGIYTDAVKAKVDVDSNKYKVTVVPADLTVVDVSVEQKADSKLVVDTPAALEDLLDVTVEPEGVQSEVTCKVTDGPAAIDPETNEITATGTDPVTIEVTVKVGDLEITREITITPEAKEPDVPDENEGKYPIDLSDADVKPGDAVDVDGKKYIVDENLQIWVENQDCKILVTYSYTKSAEPGPDKDPALAEIHQTYPIGMRVWQLNFTENETSSGYSKMELKDMQDIMLYQGTSIRMVGNRGIRLFTQVPVARRDALAAGQLNKGSILEGYQLVEYGTLFGLVENSTDLVFDPNVTTNRSLAYGSSGERTFSNDGTNLRYTGMLVFDVDDAKSLENCAKEILWRPYMVLEKDGQQVVIHGGMIQRSVGYVAYQNRNLETTAENHAFIMTIVDYVYGKSDTQG